MLERVRRRSTEVERLMNSEYPPIRRFFEGILLDGERIAASFPLLLHSAPPPHWKREIPLGDGTTITISTSHLDKDAAEPPRSTIYVTARHGHAYETRELQPASAILQGNPDPEELGNLLADLKEVKETLEQVGVVPAYRVLNSSPASQ